MTDKLEAFSQPVGYFFEWQDAETGEKEWCECSKQNGVALYSQEYVTALLDENQYLKVKIKEMDLLFGGLLLTMQAAVIEQEHGEGPAAAMQWIFNKLLGPGEFAPDSEKDAQDFFNRESEKIDVEFAKCQEFYKQHRESKSHE